MLRVETHKNLSEPRNFEATRVLVRDKHGNPIALVVDDGFVHVSKLGDSDFEQMLEMHGINRTIVVEDFEPANTDIQIH